MKLESVTRCVMLVGILGWGVLAKSEYRTIEGTGNNLVQASWGAAGEVLQRVAPAAYPGDGSGSTILSSPDRANPRAISNTLFPQVTSTPNARGMTAGVWQWGQFLDHDLSLTLANSADPAMIFSPADPYGMAMVPFSRSLSVTDSNGVRQHVNEITSYIDASMVYGSDAARATALREHAGGRLQTSAGGLLLPTSNLPGLGTLANDNGGLGATTLFVAGDIRANEQTGLTAMHTLFVREHNRVAGQLSALHAGDTAWDDERLYQSARAIVGAQVQAITYNEFLPALMGVYAPTSGGYSYSAGVDASIATEFSAAFFRLGHSMLNEQLLLVDTAGQQTGALTLVESFFNPQLVIDSPEIIDKTLMGLMAQQANELDTQLIDGVRNFLFAPSGGVGTDLASLNIQRGRDHGLPDYNTLRVAYGLSPAATFADITSDAAVQASLALLYGDVDNIDPWVGALAEEQLAGASVGELMGTALIDQFTRLRDGDRFFYRGDAELISLASTVGVDLATMTLTDVIVWNTAMAYEDMPPSFFMGTLVPEPSALALIVLGMGWGSGRRSSPRG
ncbi:peroxidase family protein [Botrimarina hoheduenensis]|uniref:Peroxidase n=1 Tax=Botrimarina hoheduenensis TaxID=2528000 RepID=A0A5C5VVE3_9BACT|nr:peroxidase family protein [Botrimarina hoheduenensis]TWT42548.1 peroxidase [Botrimarina hoheduenensis]